MSSETWKRTGDNRLVQTIENGSHVLTREFNFSDRDVTTTAISGSMPPTSTYEEFRFANQDMVREAWETMRLLDAQFKIETVARLRHENTAAVVDIFRHPLSHDVTAPQKASFPKKGPRVT